MAIATELTPLFELAKSLFRVPGRYGILQPIEALEQENSLLALRLVSKRLISYGGQIGSQTLIATLF